MIRIQLGKPSPTSDQPGLSTTRIIKASKFETREVVLTLKTLEEQGREAWTYLHTTDDEPEIAIARFEKLIPAYGCVCLKDYKEIKKSHPFDLSSKDAFFVSGVVIHNEVNKKLIAEGDATKRIVSIDEARKIWNRPAT